MRRPIFVKFSGMIDIHLNFIRIFLFFKTSNITSYIDVFVKFWVSFCPEVFSETVRDINFQFSGIVDEISKLCIGAIKFHSREKRQSSPWPEKTSNFSMHFCSHFRQYLFIQKYFVKTIRRKVVGNDKPYSTISSFRGQPFKLRAERGPNYFLNISKTKKNLLSIIEAKLLDSTFCISWYQRNENWLRNKGS